MGYNYEVAGEELAKTFEKFAQMAQQRADLENKIVLSTYERRQKLNDEEAKYKRDRQAKIEDRDHLDPLKQVQLEIQKRKLKDMEALDGLFSQEFGQSKMPDFSLTGAMADGGMSGPSDVPIKPRFDSTPIPIPQKKGSSRTSQYKDVYALAGKMANDKYGEIDKRTGKRIPVAFDKVKEFLPVAKKYLETGEMDESLMPKPAETPVPGNKEPAMKYAPGAEPDALTPQAVGPNDIRAKRFPNKYKYYPETEQERAGKKPDKFGFRIGTIQTTPKGRFRYVGNNIWSIVK